MPETSHTKLLSRKISHFCKLRVDPVLEESPVACQPKLTAEPEAVKPAHIRAPRALASGFCCGDDILTPFLDWAQKWVPAAKSSKECECRSIQQATAGVRRSTAISGK
jgi:hypothetical protein